MVHGPTDVPHGRVIMPSSTRPLQLLSIPSHTSGPVGRQAPEQIGLDVQSLSAQSVRPSQSLSRPSLQMVSVADAGDPGVSSVPAVHPVPGAGPRLQRAAVKNAVPFPVLSQSITPVRVHTPTPAWHGAPRS